MSGTAAHTMREAVICGDATLTKQLRAVRRLLSADVGDLDCHVACRDVGIGKQMNVNALREFEE